MNFRADKFSRTLDVEVWGPFRPLPRPWPIPLLLLLAPSVLFLFYLIQLIGFIGGKIAHLCTHFFTIYSIFSLKRPIQIFFYWRISSVLVNRSLSKNPENSEKISRFCFIFLQRFDLDYWIYFDRIPSWKFWESRQISSQKSSLNNWYIAWS